MSVDEQTRVSWLRDLIRIREFEEALEPLALGGEIPGGVHVASGQEAVAVGTRAALGPDDIAACSHRMHHHALAAGISMSTAMAELFGKATGCAAGRGGTMHLTDMSSGLLPGNGIVGASIGLAAGAALAAKQLEREQVAVAFFGEGATNTGRTWESLNLAVVWELPLVAVCENNQYAVETPITTVFGGTTILDRPKSFGLRTVQVDGQDTLAVYEAVAEARSVALEGTPSFIEALTYRFHGHSSGEEDAYRTVEEVESWRRRDPIDRMLSRLDESSQETLKATLIAEAQKEVSDAVESARDAPFPLEDRAPTSGVGAT